MIFTFLPVDHTISLSLSLPLSLPLGGRYSTYAQLMVDLRRMLTNAIVYNKKHVDTDSTGLSKAVYEAAMYLQEKLERLLNSFSVDVADKLLRGQLINEEKYKKESAVRQREEEIEKELRLYRAEELGRLKREDEHFARDHDIELRKAETRYAAVQ